MGIEWLIYLANLCGSLSVVAAIGATCLFLGTCVYLAESSLNNCSSSLPDEVKKKAKMAFCGAAACLVLSAVLPDTHTIYLIAGAHYGKQAINTDIGQKVEKLLNQKLDQALKDSK